jgi:tetratricopeptide (TPR) repeat protein
MTNRTEAGAEKSFVSTLLPWTIAGALAVVYLLTVNHWISFKNLHAVSRATGQTWMPDVYAPVFVLITSPFRWLPETMVPLVMNLFSVVCAFFVLVLLARCVALLPHDRTEKQREREKSRFALLTLPTAWIPPVLAALVFGLQLTFWENATTLSSGIFDLLLFAYAVRCLLEYRVDKRESWLLRAAVVYAVGVTESWVLAGLFPFFLGAIIWMMGLKFFQLRFVSRLFLCLLVGFLFFFYLPLMHLRTNGSFWIPLKQNFTNEFIAVKFILHSVPHYVQFLLIFTSLLPITIIGIRWKSSFGDTSELGVALATWVFHLTHFALLAVCIWAAFDTGFGLRDAANRFYILSNNRDFFLPFYFLSALSIGYFAGYFLVVFKPLVRRGRPTTGAQKFFSVASSAIVYALLVLTPIGLLFKNLPAIHFTNGPALQNFAAALAEKLPSKGVVLSDNGDSLVLTRSWLARSGKAQDFLFLDTHAVQSLAYYRFQTRQHPQDWPQVFTNITQGDALIGHVQMSLVLKAIAEKHPIYYLHPSFGAYFELFYAVPHGLVNELRPYSTNTVMTPPPLSDAELAENEAFWKQHDTELNDLLLAIAPPPPEQKPGFRQQWMNKMHIPFEKNATAVQISYFYSRALNTWGVAAQGMGRLDSAAVSFDKAAQLVPENLVASANLDFNKKLRKGERVAVENPEAFQARFGKFGDWQGLLNLFGSFDEPTGCLAEGIVFARGRLEREAAQKFLRSLSLAPEGLLARLWLARVYVILGQPEKSLALADELNARSGSFMDAAINPSDVLEVELAANYVSGAHDKVQNIVRTTLAQKPPDPYLVDTAIRVATYYRDFSTALLAQDKQLQMSPDSVTSLINKGYLEIQVTNYAAALPPLDKALSLAPTNTTAIYFHALSYFETGKLDEAQRGYEQLRQLAPQAPQAYHGLGEIAFQKKDTNSAIRYFQLDLTNVPPNSPEAKFATDRLHSLTNRSQ